MLPLESLAREAQGLAMGAPALSANESEVDRVMRICNACRYCEGFCAVFPAMTRRLDFSRADVHYLANLCHNCGACLHACQYAPPHEFAVNLPRAMARVRIATYADFAWPQSFAGLYKRNGTTLSVALAAGLALFVVLAMAANGTLNGEAARGDFYRVFPHDLLVGMFAPVFALAILALAIGVVRFWRATSPGVATAPAIGETARDVLRLKYLDGGHGAGCNDANDEFSLWRRRFHHFTFYGFMFCFVSTCVATVYHYAFGWTAPYDVTSLPVVLGSIGGIGLLVGPAGLGWLNFMRHPLHVAAEQRPMDLGFLTLLFLVSLTGLALLFWRSTAALPILLAVHLGTVMALFITLPYGKFAHGFFRTAAILKWAIERRQPTRLMIGPD